MFGAKVPGGPMRRRGDDREVRPYRPVWVDLARVYRVTGPIEPFPEGWDLQAEVPGELSGWRRTTTGHVVAEVRYRVRRGDGSTGGVIHTQWVPKEAVRPREDAPARKDQSP